MARYLNTGVRFTLAVIALCGVVLIPLLALSPADASVAAVAWLVGVGFSYLAARSVPDGEHSGEESESNTAD